MSGWKMNSLAAAACAALASCAGDKAADNATPAAAERPGLAQRLSEGGGYKQNENGEWVPKSDKRSAYDSQRDSPYFKGKVETERYKTGEYAKKSWWGSKDYGKKSYEGNTDGSRFQTAARQDGQVARDAGKAARGTDPFQTNTLARETAREASSSAIDRPTNAAVESRRSTYKAPAVVDWKEQRSMSIDRSRGILGR
jgi:hypothetical protein